MINLLPPDLKEDYRYARRNRRLVGWAAAFGVAIFGVAAIAGAGSVVMSNSADTYKTHIADEQAALASQDIAGTQQQVATISNNLKLMVKVLSKEILFSKLLTQLGTITPPNVALTGLSISQTESAIDITAQTANYNAATQLQANLADPANKIFSNADLVNITCTPPSKATNAKYPCTASFRAQFTANNPFLFINANTPKAGT